MIYNVFIAISLYTDEDYYQNSSTSSSLYARVQQQQA